MVHLNRDGSNGVFNETMKEWFIERDTEAMDNLMRQLNNGTF